MLGWFAREFFERSPVLAFPVIALCMFFGVFVVMFIRALRTPAATADALARMPLDEVRHDS